MTIIIEDDAHCEWIDRFDRFLEAVEALKRYVDIAWDQPPNEAPCMEWRTCGREYRVIEYDSSQKPWKHLRSVLALKISAKGVEWVEGYEAAWKAEER